MPGRDLHIGIDADDKGFERAFRDAEESAKGLDRELGRVERQQKLTEFATKRASDAVRRYGRDQDKAAIAARKAGDVAEKAAVRADIAIRRAAEAADKLAHGEISEAAAARTAAQAEQAIEKSALAAAAAHRAAARAADEQADQERQLAKAAAEEAAAEAVAAAAAARAGKLHNRAIAGVRSGYQRLPKQVRGAFGEISGVVGGAAKFVATKWEAAGFLIRAGIVALPLAAAAAGAGITYALGGAILGVGVLAAAQNKKVQTIFKELVDHVKKGSVGLGQPMVAELQHVAQVGAQVFDSLEPHLAAAVAKMAPTFHRFVDTLGDELQKAGPFIDQMAGKFNQLFGVVIDKLPSIGHAIGSAFDKISKSTSPQAVELLIDSLDGLIAVIGEITADAAALASGLGYVWDVLKIGATGLKDIGSSVVGADGRLGIFQTSLTGTATSADILTGKIGKLTQSMEDLAGKNLTVAESETRLQEAMQAANKDIDASGHHLTRLSQLSVDNQQRLEGIADAAQNLRQVMSKAGKDSSGAMASARASFIRAATSMGLTKAAANRLADSFGLVRQKAKQADPAIAQAARERKLRLDISQWTQAIASGKRHLASVPASRRAKLEANIKDLEAKVARAKRELASIRSKSVTVTLNYHSNLGGVERRYPNIPKAKGGLVGYASGGRVQNYPSGGMVFGPGTTTSDSIPALLSNREFVVNAKETAANLPLLQSINSGALRRMTKTVQPVHRAAVAGGTQRIVLEWANSRTAGDKLFTWFREQVKVRGGVEAAIG